MAWRALLGEQDLNKGRWGRRGWGRGAECQEWNQELAHLAGVRLWGGCSMMGLGRNRQLLCSPDLSKVRLLRLVFYSALEGQRRQRCRAGLPRCGLGAATCLSETPFPTPKAPLPQLQGERVTPGAWKG